MHIWLTKVLREFMFVKNPFLVAVEAAFIYDQMPPPPFFSGADNSSKSMNQFRRKAIRRTDNM